MGSIHLEHDEHLGSALLHFLFRVLHDVHTCLARPWLESLLGDCMMLKDASRPPACCVCQGWISEPSWGVLCLCISLDNVKRSASVDR